MSASTHPPVVGCRTLCFGRLLNQDTGDDAAREWCDMLGPTVGWMHQDRPLPDRAQRPTITRHDVLNWVMICQEDSWLISSILGGAIIDAASSSSCCLVGDTEPETILLLRDIRTVHSHIVSKTSVPKRIRCVISRHCSQPSLNIAGEGQINSVCFQL